MTKMRLFLICVVALFLPFGDALDEFEKQLVDDFHTAVNRATHHKEMERTNLSRTRKDTRNNETLINARFAELDKRDQDIADIAEIQLRSLQELRKKRKATSHPIPVEECFLKAWREKFGSYCDVPYEGPACDPYAPYRTAEGYCNNLVYPTRGGVMVHQFREIPAMYDDGISSPNQKGRFGRPLPSPRAVSNAVFRVNGLSPRDSQHSVMVMSWGQLIDHDMVATPTIRNADRSGINCCEEGAPDIFTCLPIAIPGNDPFFKGKTCMNFVRSVPATSDPCAPGRREQKNQITSYIDASFVYGISESQTLNLRAMEGGLLRTSPNDLLPANPNGRCRIQDSTDFCMLAGEARALMVPSLGAVHTLFMRQHNSIATRLAELNPQWNDEKLFQESRKIMAAISQHINYNEYLKIILNKKTRTDYDLDLSEGYNNKYDPEINPTIANVFAAAAFRFGHSQIPDHQAILNSNGDTVLQQNIETTFFSPHMISHVKYKPIQGMCKWLATDLTPRADGLFESGTRDKLFLNSNGNSFDLPALNMQRGRDHGLPSYNYWRVFCGLEQGRMSVENGLFILPNHHTKEQISKLMDAYKHVDDIDLFAGAMTETHMPDSAVGPTFACLIGRQFQRLKNGDRFWYESDDPVVKFTPDQLASIKSMTLAKMLCENGEVYIQPNVFLVPGPGNELAPCRENDKMDLSAWAE